MTKSVFNHVTEIVFGLMLLFLVIGIAIGAARLFFNLKDMITSGMLQVHIYRPYPVCSRCSY